MTRRPPLRRTVVVACAATVLALTACSGGSTGPGPSGGASAGADAGSSAGSAAAATPAGVDKPVTITWWTGQFAEAQKTLDGLAKEFTTLHPNVTVQASSGAPTTDALLEKLTAGLASNTYPDVSYAFGSWATQLGDSGKTLDITAKVADPSVGWTEFPQSARETASPGGKVLGFPALVDNLALIYNPTLFAAAGVAEPTPDWTWDDFRAAAKKLTDPGRNIYGTAYSVSGSEDTTWHFWPLLWQRGGEVLSADQKKSAFNSQAGVDALELLRAMAVDDKSVYLDQTDEKYGPLFTDGRVAMIISGPWQLFDLVQKKTPYKVSVLPGYNGNHTTVSGPDVWALFDHQDPARAYWSFELLKWLTSSAIDIRWNLAQGNLPLRTASASSPEFAAYVKEYPGGDVMFANLKNATKPRPTVTGYVGLSRYVGEAIAKTLQGGAQPQQALDDAAKKADVALAGE